MTTTDVTDARLRADAAMRWWKALGPRKLDDGRVLPGDRAALARLRRCATVLEAAAEPATARLYTQLAFAPSNDADGLRAMLRTALLAAVLAHVRDGTEARKIARALGAPPGGKPEDAALKPNRFRTLMAARTEDDLLIAFRRAVALLGRKANVGDLAGLILGWTDDAAGDRLRTRFAFDYHGAADAAPDRTPSTGTAP